MQHSSSSTHGEPRSYEQLNKPQKLALFMIIIGPEAAADLLRNFDDSEIEAICQEMASFNLIDQQMQVKVVEEFSGIIGESMGGLLGGFAYTQQTLELAKGDYRAASILGRISPDRGTTNEVIAEIGEMEPRQVYNLIRAEQPQTIAFIISHLSLDKAAEILAMLPPELREMVTERIGTMDTTSMELVDKVVQNLRRHFASNQKQTMHSSGGVRTVANLLNMMEKDVSKNLLGKLEERNPTLGGQIRKKMFSFEDLLRLDPGDLQRVLREVEMNDLVISLKSANPALAESIFGAVSKRAAETLQEEVEMLGPVRLKDVEAAQDRIIQVVRRLEEEGEITIETSSGKGDVIA